MNEKYICADCGHKQDSMYRPCDQCMSSRIVTIEFAIFHFGPNYMDAFKEQKE